VYAIVSGVSTISIAGTDGALLASANFTKAAFHPHPFMSWTSASLGRLYYLDKGTDVRYLARAGSTGWITRISVGPNEQAGFAVSPDDKRIAVSIFSYSPASDQAQPPSYKGMRLYVEDLQGGGRHVEIFDSTTEAEYPIGWTGGNLILAVSAPDCCQRPPLNPYGATTIHVANPDTGRRLVSLCTDYRELEGPIETFGVMCTDQGAQFLSWDGIVIPPLGAIGYPQDRLNAVSPDGKSIALGKESIFVWGKRVGNASARLDVSGYVYGWLDDDHIVFRKVGATSISIYDLRSRNYTDLAGQATYLGTLPTAVY
jgi:hypothetical protein